MLAGVLKLNSHVVAEEGANVAGKLHKAVMEECMGAMDDGFLDKTDLTNTMMSSIAGAVGGVAGSLLSSAGVLVPGASVVVDICKCVLARFKLLKKNQEAAKDLGDYLRVCRISFNANLKALTPYETFLQKMITNSVLDDETVQDWKDSLDLVREYLPELWVVLVRAGRLTKINDEKNWKKQLKTFCGAGNVSLLCWLSRLSSWCA
jgi:hypothetical protein